MNIFYEIKEIPPKGLGIFSKQFISKGSIIWNFKKEPNVVVISDEKLIDYLNKYEETQIEDILNHMFCINGMCYNVQKSDVKYINHSKNPNSYVNKDGDSIAIRDINIDEEITEDYSLYDNYSFNYNKLNKIYNGDNWLEEQNNWD